MKTDEQVLKECIKIAVSNGWRYEEPEYEDWIADCNFEYDLDDRGLVSDHLTYLSLEELLFSHSFCKSLFGTQKVKAIGEYETESWKAAICNLAVAEDRIDYLRQYLETI